MIKKFIEEYKILVIVFAVSTVYVCLYPFINKNVVGTENFAIVLNILFQLGIGLIVNTIFLYSQVYLLKRKQQKYIDKVVADNVGKICLVIERLFFKMNEMYSIKGSMEEYEESDFLLLLRKVKLDDVVPGVLRTYPNGVYTLKEYIVDTVGKIEYKTERLCRLFGPYLSMELMVDLNEILNSPMHTSMARSLVNSPVDFSNALDGSLFFSYYELKKKLELEKEKLIDD